MVSIFFFSIANSSFLSLKGSNASLIESKLETSQQWRQDQNTKVNLLKEFQGCEDRKIYPTVELACSQYGKTFITYLSSCKPSTKFYIDSA